MRFQSLTLFLALGTVGTVACGGIGTAGESDGTGGPPLKNGTYQAPPSTYDAPGLPNPTDYEPPGTDYETPPDQSEAGGPTNSGSIAAVCNRICLESLALDCDAEGSPASAADCAQGCAVLDAEIPCPGPYAAALSCLFDHLNLTCELLTGEEDEQDIENLFDDIESCRAPFEELARCAGSEVDQQPPPEEPPACQPNSCRNCANDCQECLCENDYDATYCSDSCGGV